ncbi:hypothetical protein RQP46_001306 [Phenoliferia psychrophenolica]
MKIVAQKGGVVPHIKLRHSIVGAAFNEATSTWSIKIQDVVGAITEQEFDIYVAATGVLSQVNRPDINGIKTFTKSPIIHTAEWPRDLDWKTAFQNERVGVIGIGSSGLQTIGAITPFTKSVEIFARSKFWTSPPFVAELAGVRDWDKGNFSYSDAEHELFRTNPEGLFKHTSELTAAINHTFDVFFHDSPGQKMVRDLVYESMVKDLRGNKDLIEKLIPEWDGNLLPSITAAFMEAVHEPHVHLHTDPIETITPDGIKIDGKVIELDRIILATGFDTSFVPKYEISAKGKSLGDVWAKRAKGYLSLAVAGFPNLIFMCGVGTTFANGSVLAGMEVNADYIVACLTKMQTQDILAMEVTQEAQDEYNAQQDSLMQDLVFSDACSSWYKGGSADGKPDALYAGSILSFLELLNAPRWEDFAYKRAHPECRFSFLGNGTGTVEAKGENRAYYLKLEDHIQPLVRDDYVPS